MSTAVDLNEKSIVVVGGSSGIGLGVARAALDAGARVTLVARSKARLDAARTALSAGDRARVISADIGREAEMRRLFEETGPVDHIAVTAVTAAYQPIAELELDAAQRVIDSKIVGPLLIAKHGAPRVRPGGSLTLTSGFNCDRPAIGGSVVAATNGALGALGRALAIELAPLRVNVVSPGWVDTPIWDGLAGERKTALHGAMAERLPVRRIGTTTDVAQTFMFLMTNRHMTGSVVHIDGGQRLV